MTRRALGVAAALVGLAVLGACGKKGPPLPPLRPLPARITDITARAVDDRVDIALFVPMQNADGTTPPVVDRVALYALAETAAAPAPVSQPGAAAATTAPQPASVPASAIVQPDNLVAEVSVDVPETAGGEDTPAGPIGLVIPHEIAALAARPDAPTIRYVAVAIGRGRRGQTSPVVAVPLARRPAAPQGVGVTFDASTITVSWDPAGEGVATSVDELDPSAGATGRIRRSTAPEAGASFALPVSFGEARCFEVRHVVVAGRATVEGPASAGVCVTPVDRFAPPAPGALVAIAEDGVVVLSWRGVDAADLAGYVVLRGEGASETLQPLTPSPMTERSYRDTTVRPGVIYTYAVVAVDRALPPNRSPESNRQTVTARY